MTGVTVLKIFRYFCIVTRGPAVKIFRAVFSIYYWIIISMTCDDLVSYFVNQEKLKSSIYYAYVRRIGVLFWTQFYGITL